MSLRLRLAVCVCLVFAALGTARPAASPSAATISVTGGVSGLAMGTTAAPAFVVSLSQPATAGLEVQIILSGEGAPGSSVAPAPLVFGPGDTSRTYSLTSGFNLGQLQISYQLSGPDAANYTAPAPHFVDIKAPMQYGGMTGTIVAGQSAGGQVSVSQVPIQGDLIVSFSLSGPASAGATVSPSSVTITGFNGYAPFTVTAGPATGELVLNVSVSGPAALKHAAPGPWEYSVIYPQSTPVLSGFPFAFGSVQQNAPTPQMIITLPVPPPNGLTLTPVFSGSAAATTTASPASLVFAPGETSKSFTFTTSGVGFVGFQFAASGPDAAQYLVGTLGGGYNVRGKTTVVNAPAILQRNATSAPITVQLSAPAPVPFTITPQLNPSNAASVLPSVLSFGAGETSKTFTLTVADPVSSFVEVILVPSSDGIQSFEQAPATPFKIATPVKISTNQTATTAFVNLPVSISLPYAAPEPFTVDLTVSGSAAPVTLSQQSVSFNAGETSKTISIASFPRAGDLTISGTVSGPGSIYFPGAAPHTITIQTFLGLSLTDNFNVVHGQPLTTSLTLSAPVPEAVTATLTPVGMGSAGSSFSPQSVTFQPGQTSVPITFNAGTAIGEVTVSYAFSGPGSSYVLPRQRAIRVLGTVSFENKPSLLVTGQTSAPITIRLSHPTPTAFTMSLPVAPLSMGGTASPSSIAWAVGETTKTFTVTAGATMGTLFVNAHSPVPGFYQSAQFTITVGNTPVGTDVHVAFPPSFGVSSSVDVTFTEVTTAGRTSVGPVSPQFQPAAPSGFEVPGSPLFFGWGTTAIASGPVVVCASYPDGAAADETGLRLFRRVGTTWVDTTISVDSGGNVICGQIMLTTGSAGIFAIFRLNTAPSVGTIDGPSLVEAGVPSEFTAVITDPDAADVHTGTWIWGDGSTSPATIATVDGVKTAKGTHAFAEGGTFAIALVVSDGGQQARSADHSITVDGAAPVITAVTATPDLIWPPDNKMHAVTVAVDASDDSGVPVCLITKVDAAAEKAPGLEAEYVVTGPFSLAVRAAMFRTYTITVTCTDAVERKAEATVIVRIAKEN